MPGGDRTGPRGMGPRTGRGMGFCSGYDTPGYMNPGFGGGYGYGRGGDPLRDRTTRCRSGRGEPETSLTRFPAEPTASDETTPTGRTKP